MIKRSILVFVSFCLLLSALALSTSAAQDPVDNKQVEQIKREVAALGDGARVSLKLRNNRKVTGHLNYVGDEFLQITDAKSKATVKIPYTDVIQIERKEKPRLSKSAKIAIGVVGALFVMGMIANGGE